MNWYRLPGSAGSVILVDQKSGITFHAYNCYTTSKLDQNLNPASVETEFKFQSNLLCSLHTNTLWRDINPPFLPSPPAMG